ncbi:MAG: hypothetical protein GDA36_12915 [Rhodobacteraceae bacterium]|nr:hypothetical protein [Paracoccaceae bacterium]
MTHSWTGGGVRRHASCTLGRTGIGPQGYDPMVRFNCLLIGQCHPEAGAGVENSVEFHAVLRFRPLCT